MRGIARRRRRRRLRLAGRSGAANDGLATPNLALRLDDDRDLGRESAEHLDRDLVRAEGLERLLEVDLVAFDVDAAAGERVGDVLGGDRAVELAALADLDAHRQGRRSDPGRRDLGIFALALALVLAARDVVLPRAIRAARGRDGDALRDQEVGGIT